MVYYVKWKIHKKEMRISYFPQIPPPQIYNYVVMLWHIILLNNYFCAHQMINRKKLVELGFLAILFLTKVCKIMKTLGFFKFFQLFSNWKNFLKRFRALFSLQNFFEGGSPVRSCATFSKKNLFLRRSGPSAPLRSGGCAASAPFRFGPWPASEKFFFGKCRTYAHDVEPPSKKSLQRKKHPKTFQKILFS